MSDVNKIVTTVMRTVDHASGPMRAVAASAMSAGSALRSAISPVTALVGGLASLAAAHGLVQLHSQAEDAQGVLAGMLQTFGAASDFNSGLTMASETMDSIAAAAARLPGEAADYAATFQMGFANFQSQFGTDVQAAVAFSNQMTAVASSLSVPAQQISTDVARLTQAGRGGAGADVLTWMRMMPYVTAYRQSMHQSALSAEQFNVMSQSARIQLLNGVTHMQSLQSVLDRAGGSWSAQVGGLKSALQLIARRASTPLFEEARATLGRVNGALMNADGQLSAFSTRVVGVGLSISQHIVGGFRRASSVVEQMTSRLQHSGIIGRGAGMAQGLAGRFMAQSRGQQIGQGAAAAGMLMGIPGLGLLAMVFMRLSRDTQFLRDSFEGVRSIARAVYPVMERVSLGMADFVRGVLPGVVHGLAALVGPAQNFVATLMPYLGPIGTNLGALLGAIGPVVGALANALMPVIGLVAQALSGMLGALGDFARAVGATNNAQAAHAASNAAVADNNAVARNLSAIEDTLGVARGHFHTLTQGVQLTNDEISALAHATRVRGGYETRTVLDGMIAQRRHTAATTAAAAVQENAARTATRAAHRPTPAARAGHHTTNDFRNSRFDVMQRFAEGFDPDRVAVAFTQDLERGVNQRLQSGLEPVFGVT